MKPLSIVLAGLVITNAACAAETGAPPATPVPLTLFEINALTIALQNATGKCAPGAEIFCQIGMMAAPLLNKLSDAQKVLSAQPVAPEKK